MLAVVTQINGEDCTLPFHAGICMTRVAKKSRVATFQGRPPRPFLPLTKRPCLFKVSFNKVAARTLWARSFSTAFFSSCTKKPPCGCPRTLNQIKKHTAELTGFLFCLFCRKAAVWLLLLRDLKISAVLVLYPPAMTESFTKWTNSILAAG